MTSRFWLGFGLALCTTVTASTYVGTRAVLEQIRAEDSGRSDLIRRLEEKLTALERSDSALEHRLRAISAARTVPSHSDGAAAADTATAEAAGSAAPMAPEAGAPRAAALFPGAVLHDWNLLSEAERRYLEQYPPDDGTILVRGEEGKLGCMRIVSKRDGQPTEIILDDENIGLIEEFTTAIVDVDAAQRAALLDLAATGAGTDCATSAEAGQRGYELGNHYTIQVGERFRVIPSLAVERDRRVAAARERLERLKRDFGDHTSYVLHWTDPARHAP